MCSKQNVVGQIYQKLLPAASTQHFAHNILMLNLNLAALNVDVIVIKQVFYICGDFLFSIRNGIFRGGAKNKTILNSQQFFKPCDVEEDSLSDDKDLFVLVKNAPKTVAATH